MSVWIAIGVLAAAVAVLFVLHVLALRELKRSRKRQQFLLREKFSQPDSFDSRRPGAVRDGKRVSAHTLYRPGSGPGEIDVGSFDAAALPPRIVPQSPGAQHSAPGTSAEVSP